jgi:hypothetical protein
MKLSLLLILLQLSLLATGPARAACDPSSIEGALFYTDADSVLYNNRWGAQGLGKEGFDFRTGRLFASRLGFNGVRLMDVRGSDTYQIEGAPSGIPIPLHVELQVHAVLGNAPPREGLQLLRGLQLECWRIRCGHP